MVQIPVVYPLFSRLQVSEIKTERKQVNASPRQMRLVLTVVESGQIVSVPLGDRMVIGRDDNEGSHHLDIDLSKVDGVRYGLSRWHALFMHDAQGLFVEDLNSTNGTRINGYRIEAGRPYHLRNGDELELGTLRLTVRMVHQPC
ncbi:MAG TPA: FHA domain-containing protein [Phototrophicaceae bacterium]|nr:FHA domain-containing protein [Phototrophicaceae bacterium]